MYNHAILNTPMRIKAIKTRYHYDSIEFSSECLPCFTHLASHQQRTGAWFVASTFHSWQGSQSGMRAAQISTDGCQQHYEGHNFQCHYLQPEPLHSSLVGSRQRAGFEHLIRHLDQANRLQNLRHKLFHPSSAQLPPVQVTQTQLSCGSTNNMDTSLGN